MSKLTALAIGMLMVISIAPKSQAMTTKIEAPALQPAANLHSQIILKAADESREYSNHRRHDESEDRHQGYRRGEREREREQKYKYERERERQQAHEREAAEHHRHKVPPTAIIKIGDIITIKL
jgi:DNA-binding LacI/PurR family transcriptional regulator